MSPIVKSDRVNSDLNQGKKVERIPIKLKELSAIEKGFFNIPKEVIEEFIAYKYQVPFLPKNDNGNNTDYYYCNADGCQYRIKIKENFNLLKSITSASLISSFTNFDLSNPSELSEGICHLTEYGEHINNHNKEQNQKIEFKKPGIFLFPYLFNFIRSFSLSKTNNQLRKNFFIKTQKLPD